MNELTEQMLKDVYKAIDNIPTRKTLIITDCAELTEEEQHRLKLKAEKERYTLIYLPSDKSIFAIPDEAIELYTKPFLGKR